MWIFLMIIISIFTLFILVAVICTTNEEKAENKRKADLEQSAYTKKLLYCRKILDKGKIDNGSIHLYTDSKHVINLSLPLNNVEVVRNAPGPFNHEFVEGAVLVNFLSVNPLMNNNRLAVLPYEFAALTDEDIVKLIHASIGGRAYT